jgi:hypothetical protein
MSKTCNKLLFFIVRLYRQHCTCESLPVVFGLLHDSLHLLCRLWKFLALRARCGALQFLSVCFGR